MFENANELVSKFMQENQDFTTIFILDEVGSIKYCSNPDFIKEEEGKELMDIWMTKKSAVVIDEIRYAVLSWEIYQFAARNVKGHGALVGAKVKSGHYIIGHLKPDAKMAPAIGAITLNRWSFSLF